VAAALFTRSAPEPVVLSEGTSVPDSVTTTPFTTRPRTTDPDPETTRRPTTRPPTTKAKVVWTPWSPPDRSFGIDFTGTPETRAFPVDNVVFSRGNGASSQTRSTIYLVGWYDVTSPRYVADSALVLNSIADSYAKESKLAFTQRSIGHFAGNPSLDFAGTISEGLDTVKLRGLEIVAGVRVFLFVAGDTGDGSADFEHFRDSFHISG
jgi:hypothetical protein